MTSTSSAFQDAATHQTMSVSIAGMTCASCVRRVETAISSVPGVLKASVNLATERATVEMAAGSAQSALEAAIRNAGYEPRLDAPGDAASEDSRQQAKEAEIQRLKRDFILAGTLTLPIFLFEMGSHFIPAAAHVLHNLDRFWVNLTFFFLATVVQFGPGMRFYMKGLPALARFAPDMNSLVMLGSSAAWGYSVVATFAADRLPEGTANVYFEASSVIVTLILLGRFLEAKAKGRTSEAIRRLMGLQPKTARVVRNGATLDIAIADVVVGDLVQVRPGERLPVDGIVETGSSFVDESMVTGEPAPVWKGEGGEVVGGTINKSGSLAFRATKVGADTLLSQIIRMVEQAQGAKLPVQALVDRITQWFVPAVILVAFATLAVWLVFGPEPALAFALINAVAVLIIACPCAMGLATPTSIMVATGRAAELGILFRKGEALQALKDVDVVAFDKTGTLTEGKPSLTDFHPVNGHDRAAVLSLIAAVESQSEHPVASAILAAAESATPLATPVGFEAEPGFGARALVNDRKVAVGSERYMLRLGVDVSPTAKQQSADLARQGKTPVFAMVDGCLTAVMAVSDPVKATTASAIRSLHESGFRLAMITGDNNMTAAGIAAQLGIDEVLAEVLPADKAAMVKHLQARGLNVAFVGDGINDAPALAQANVGIAIGTGTDVAIESADVVLMSGDLTGVRNAIELSKATIRNIVQNLFWAFAYNTLLIPVAAGALYPVTGTLLSPMLAAGAMAMSSVFVIGNAIRLKRFQAEGSQEPAADSRLVPIPAR